MKKLLYSLSAGAIGVVAFGSASAYAYGIEDAIPPCVVYVSEQTVPVSAQCAQYTLPGGTVIQPLSINEGK